MRRGAAPSADHERQPLLWRLVHERPIDGAERIRPRRGAAHATTARDRYAAHQRAHRSSHDRHHRHDLAGRSADLDRRRDDPAGHPYRGRHLYRMHEGFLGLYCGDARRRGWGLHEHAHDQRQAGQRHRAQPRYGRRGHPLAWLRHQCGDVRGTHHRPARGASDGLVRCRDQPRCSVLHRGAAP